MIERVGVGKPDWKSTLFQLSRYKFISELLAEDDIVLDVGGGEGYTSLLLSEKVKKVYSLDIDQEVFDTNKKLYYSKKVNYICANYKNYKTPQKMDAIISVHFIEHLSEEEASVFLKWSVDNLCPKKGVFITSTPRSIPNFQAVSFNRVDHKKEYAYGELQQKLNNFFHRVIIFSQTDDNIGFFHPKYAWNFIAVAWGFKN